VSRRSLVLASASPARLRLLRSAGFDPTVLVSGVVEDGLDGLDTGAAVLALAERKADAVAAAVSAGGVSGALVVGCDSLLDVDGVAVGKPGSPAAATRHWHAVRGRAATLLTGHCVIDTPTGGRATGVAATTVRFGRPTDGQIAAYVASGEPLTVAGGFTLDGRAAPFVDGVDGDPGNVIGISLPLLRALLERLGVDITDLWA